MVVSPQVITIVEPFVQRGLFESPEKAITEMARSYILRQIEHHQRVVERLQTKYSMTYDQFEAYLRARSAALLSTPDPMLLSQAIMMEEEDALDWKIAHDMLKRWLGLQAEIGT